MEVLKFDPRSDWSEWQTLYGFAHYGGGHEGGIVKSYSDGWYCWHRTWSERMQYTRIPDALDIIYRKDDGHEAVKMVMSNDTYEVGDDEHYLDDLEDDLDFRLRINETDGESGEEESEEEDSDEEESDEDMDSD